MSNSSGPRSVVFFLHSFESRTLPPPEETGQGSRRLVYDLLNLEDADTSNALHQTNGRKPYTASFFYSMREKGRYSWRVTDLSGELLPKLHSAAFPRSGPRMVNLCGVPATFEGMATTEEHDERAGCLSWRALADSRHRRVRVSLRSPTQFRSNGRCTVLLPSPYVLLQAGALSWELCANVPMDTGIQRVRDLSNLVETYTVNLRTSSCRGPGELRDWGVSGEVGLHLLSSDEADVSAFSAWLGLLPWCGAGRATGAGMGQCEVAAEDKEK